MKYRRFGTTYHLPESKLKAMLRSIVLFWRKVKRSRWQVRLALITGTALVLTGVLLLVFLNGGNQTATMQGQTSASSPIVSSSPGVLSPTEASSEPTPIPTPTPIKKGADGPDIAELQQRLMDLGYMDQDEPTEHFGPVTQAALKYFQRQAGITQDGILGDETKALLFSDAAKPYTLLQGATGEDVGAFQRRLRELGFSISIDKNYGPKTVEAVKAFQRMNKLGADGKAGEQTFNKIFSSKAVGPITLQIKLSKNINKFIQIATGEIGDPYISGHEGPSSYDCSGLVYYCLKNAGVKIGRYTAYGYSGVDEWKKISSMGSLKKGDLLFFHIDSRKVIGHVGIYIGGGMMIDASSSNGKVVKRHCDTAYWKSHFRLARRPWSI